MPACCTKSGPGYATPLEAFHGGVREKLIYLPCIIPDQTSRPDYLATVDVDPASATYSQVIHRLPMPHIGDELHHSGWNACSSCHDDASKSRSLLILPAMGSGRVYAVDVRDPLQPKLHKVVEREVIQSETNLAYPHTSHCLGSGEILISTMGDPQGEGKGSFLVLNEDLTVKGKWTEHDTPYGYDFWYQPRLNILISSEFGRPADFFGGFDPSKAPTAYGSKLYIWDWTTHKLRQTIDLGADGLIPLETRFAHDPAANWGFVGAALSSNVIAFTVDRDSGKVSTNVVIRQPWTKVEGWALPQLPPLITDILLSLNDKYLFFSNWLRGDVSVYDISDPAAPKLADRVWLGGSIAKGSGVTVAADSLAELGLTEQPEPAIIKGVKVQGGPQMLQLSLDGTRLYVTNSLLSPWDKQFYPDMAAKGSQLVQLDFNQDTGKLSINHNFLVDFGVEPDGPVLAHEARYPGGDCSSDIWL